MEEDKLMEEQAEKKYGKIQWFFVVILIPTLFAIAVALVVATVAGVNVFEKAKEISAKIPFLTSEQEEQSTKAIESKLQDLREEVKESETVIAGLEAEMESKDQEILKLQREKDQLQREIDELTIVQAENNRELKDMIKTYETMSAKKAAPIITQLNDEQALTILANIKSDTLAAIMEQMNAVDAAKYTSLLTNNSSIDQE